LAAAPFQPAENDFAAADHAAGIVVSNLENRLEFVAAEDLALEVDVIGEHLRKTGDDLIRRALTFGRQIKAAVDPPFDRRNARRQRRRGFFRIKKAVRIALQKNAVFSVDPEIKREEIGGKSAGRGDFLKDRAI